MRKKIKISEADNGFIIHAFGPGRIGRNALVLQDPVIKVFRDKQDVHDFIVAWFDNKELENVNSTALQDEMMLDEGEM